MQTNKITRSRIFIALLSSLQIFIGVAARAWEINQGMCILLLLYLVLVFFYIFHSWRYKGWNEPELTDTEQKKRALRFKSELRTIHSIFFVFLVAIPLVCSLLLLSQAVLPKYADEFVVQSFAKREYKDALDPKVISFDTPREFGAISNVSFVSIIRSNKGTACPTSFFCNLLLGALFIPVWGLAWSALLLFVAFLIAVWFAEFIGGFTFHFR
jgi:hypothetical protein